MGLQAYEALAAGALLLALMTVVQKRVVTCVGLYSFQSLLLGASTAVAAARVHAVELYLVAALTVALKTILISWVLLRIIKKLRIRQEVEPFISLPLSSFAAVLAVVVAFYVGGRLRDAVHEAHDFVLPALRRGHQAARHRRRGPQHDLRGW